MVAWLFIPVNLQPISPRTSMRFHGRRIFCLSQVPFLIRPYGQRRDGPLVIGCKWGSPAVGTPVIALEIIQADTRRPESQLIWSKRDAKTKTGFYLTAGFPRSFAICTWWGVRENAASLPYSVQLQQRLLQFGRTSGVNRQRKPIFFIVVPCLRHQYAVNGILHSDARP